MYFDRCLIYKLNIIRKKELLERYCKNLEKQEAKTQI